MVVRLTPSSRATARAESIESHRHHNVDPSGSGGRYEGIQGRPAFLCAADRLVAELRDRPSASSRV